MLCQRPKEELYYVLHELPTDGVEVDLVNLTIFYFDDCSVNNWLQDAFGYLGIYDIILDCVAQQQLHVVHKSVDFRIYVEVNIGEKFSLKSVDFL